MRTDFLGSGPTSCAVFGAATASEGAAGAGSGQPAAQVVGGGWGLPTTPSAGHVTSASLRVEPDESFDHKRGDFVEGAFCSAARPFISWIASAMENRLDAVQKLELGKYQCKVCDAVIETAPHSDPPLSILISSSNRADQRVVMINGHEIHRCQFPPERS